VLQLISVATPGTTEFPTPHNLARQTSPHGGLCRFVPPPGKPDQLLQHIGYPDGSASGARQIGRTGNAVATIFAVRAGETSDWDPPTKGEQCMLRGSTGAVQVGLHSALYPAPPQSSNEYAQAFAAITEGRHAAGRGGRAPGLLK